MNLFQLFKNIKPFVKPYRLLVIVTLILTLVGSLMQQVNAIVLDRTVIIISHSISQIIDSEMLYALQKGRVEESGHPDDVYRKGGIYKDIIDASARSLNIQKIARTIEGQA
jgi:ABC-type multidrug transport system ATPase subunit